MHPVCRLADHCLVRAPKFVGAAIYNDPKESRMMMSNIPLLNARVLLRLLAALLLVGSLSCGQSLTGIPREDAGPTLEDDVTSPPTEDVTEGELPDENLFAFSQRTAAASCSKAFECCSGAQLRELVGEGAESEEKCAQMVLFNAFVFGHSQLDESIKAGRIRADLAMVDLCVESILGTSCADFESMTSLQRGATGCAEALQPQVALGGACEMDEECITGSCLNQVCANLPAISESCEATMACEDGAFCDMNTFKCERQRADGNSCMYDEQCASQRCLDSASSGRTCGPAPQFCTAG